jgi:glycosidase
LFYGEEIGMGENLDIKGRLSVRSPMQWSDGPAGGFSTAPPERLRRPVTKGEFGPDQVNVASQHRDPSSLHNWMERLIRQRKECYEFGFGAWELLDVGDPRVLAHRCDWDGGTVVALHNFSSQPLTITLRIEGDRLVDLLGDEQLERGPFEIELQGFGYRWYRLMGG